MPDFSFSDDSMGEGFGDGLDNSALDLSGFSYDFGGEVPVQGSDLSLDFSDGSTYAGGIADLSADPSWGNDQSLSGVSDPAPSWDQSGASWNGSGTADSSYHDVTHSRDISGVSDLFASISKFGANIGAMIASQSSSQSRATTGMVPANVNPNRSTLGLTSISGSHATLLVVVAVVLIGAVAFGGTR